DLDRGGSVPVFGGYKGLCVSLVVEILAGGLSAATTSSAVARQRHALDRPMQCAQMFLAFDPLAFGVGDLGSVARELERAVTAAYDATPADVYFPGQLEANSARSAAAGIALPGAVVEDLGL